jgi:hypothetical protein
MEQPAEMQESSTETPGAGYVDTSINTAPEVVEEVDTPELLDEQPADDGEEIDYEGEKFKVPKVLKEAFMRQQDYTQKTQSVAEQRKAVEAQAAEIQQRAAMQQQFIAEYAEVHSLDSQLQQYAQVNWTELIDADPVQAMKLDRQMRELQQRREQVVSSVTQKQQQHQLQMQQETAKRMQDGKAVLEREIKGWAPGNELDNSLSEYANANGVQNIGPAIADNPKVAVFLHKAWQFDQLMKKAATPKEKPEPQEKPVTRITARTGTATKDPSQMTDREFARFRASQIANRYK